MKISDFLNFDIQDSIFVIRYYAQRHYSSPFEETGWSTSHFQFSLNVVDLRFSKTRKRLTFASSNPELEILTVECAEAVAILPAPPLPSVR
jgi:hypothetical protein